MEYIHISSKKVLLENKLDNAVTQLIISEGHDEKYDDYIQRLSMTSVILELNLKISKIGISLITDNRSKDREFNKYERNEILFAVIKDFNLHYYHTYESLNSSFGKSELELQIKHMEIYNRLRKTEYHILLEPKNKRDDFPFFTLNYVEKLNNKERVRTIENLTYLIQSFELNIEINLVDMIITFVSNITSFLNTNCIDVNPIFLMKGSTNNQERLGQNLMIKSLNMSNFSVYLSVNSDGQTEFFEKFVNGFLASMASIFATIKNTKFNLEGGTITHIYGSFYDLLSIIGNQYKKSLGSHFWKIAGSSVSNFFKNIFFAGDDYIAQRKRSDISLSQKYFTQLLETKDFRINIPLLEIAKEGFGSGLCIDISKQLFSMKYQFNQISTKVEVEPYNRQSRVFYGKYKYVSI